MLAWLAQEIPMRRFVFWSAALILLAFIGRGQGGPVHSLDAVKHHVDPLGQRQFTVSFVGQKPARAIVIGSGATYMALYVYDQFGNCVARDEPLGFLTRDDLAAE